MYSLLLWWRSYPKGLFNRCKSDAMFIRKFISTPSAFSGIDYFKILSFMFLWIKHLHCWLISTISPDIDIIWNQWLCVAEAFPLMNHLWSKNVLNMWMKTVLIILSCFFLFFCFDIFCAALVTRIWLALSLFFSAIHGCCATTIIISVLICFLLFLFLLL